MDISPQHVAKHGWSLAEAAGFDFNRAVVVEDDRRDYGERRMLAFAQMDGCGFCLVFVGVNDTTIRVISFRRAHQRELRRLGL